MVALCCPSCALLLMAFVALCCDVLVCVFDMSREQLQSERPCKSIEAARWRRRMCTKMFRKSTTCPRAARRCAVLCYGKRCVVTCCDVMQLIMDNSNDSNTSNNSNNSNSNGAFYLLYSTLLYSIPFAFPNEPAHGLLVPVRVLI